jgi:hypothetical protein
MKVAITAIYAALVLAVVPSLAYAGWTTYYGPASMGGGCGSCVISAASGYDNNTNNRVYRPLGVPFELGYDNGSPHWSTSNSTDNPFYWPAYGYNYVWCTDDGGQTSPVTCERYS